MTDGGAMNEDRGPVLLALARAAIASALGQTLCVDQSAPWLRAKGACFVTLTKSGELRGCVGGLEPRHSLLEAVTAIARAAAFDDPRFPPLDVSELESTRISVSLLSALESLPACSEEEALCRIRPYVDGLLLECGRRRARGGVPPRPAGEKSRDLLGHLKLKAGLPDDFWSDEIRLYRYQVSKWSEPEIGRTVQ